MQMRLSTGALVAGALLALATTVAGQAALRTPVGQPDLQGVWDFQTLTPLERPVDQGQAFLTDKQVAKLEEDARRRLDHSELDLPGVGYTTRPFLDDRTNVVKSHRTSLIIDPSDGRLPTLTPRGEALRQVGSFLMDDLPIDRPVRVRSAGGGSDGPEDRGLAERCLVGSNSGPPMMPGSYNNNMQIFQTPDHVVILNEMVHDARIIPLDDRPHLPDNMRQWMGDSRGRWEDDTLVVETTNLTEYTGSFDPSYEQSMGTGLTVTLTERFRKFDADTMLYEYTVDDPKIFTRPFSVELSMRRNDEPMYEYACHEGNYSLLNILRSARVDEARQQLSAQGLGLGR